MSSAVGCPTSTVSPRPAYHSLVRASKARAAARYSSGTNAARCSGLAEADELHIENLPPSADRERPVGDSPLIALGRPLRSSRPSRPLRLHRGREQAPPPAQPGCEEAPRLVGPS